MNQPPPFFEFRDISRSFFGTQVLHGVTFPLARGRVLGLVGENGAGKSTLMNILAGVLPPDAGTMSLDGHPYAPRRPRDAAAAGITFVHQELNLFTNLSIAENLHIDAFPRRTLGRMRLPLIDHAAARARAAELLGRVDLRRDPRTLVSQLSPGERQLVEIARALGADARLLILDEPTTSLTAPETQRLFQIIGRLKARGVAIIYISHRLEDVLALCDDIVLLRDGRVVSTGPVASYNPTRMIAEMVGRDVDQLFAQRPSRPPDQPILRVERLNRGGLLHDISLTLHRGEVLGVAGLMGAGRTELARAIYGLDPIDSGRILLDDVPFAPSPRRSIGRGIALVTEDRREEGLLMDASVLSNGALVALPRFARTPLKFIARRLLAQRVGAATRAAHVRAADLDRQAARTLSGGNQQKLVLAKWLVETPRVLILDEPTRGVDVGAKQELYRVIDELVGQRGTAVLVISSEIEELIGLCDRVLVMSRGRIVDRIEREHFDRERMLRSALAGPGDGSAVA